MPFQSQATFSIPVIMETARTTTPSAAMRRMPRL